VTDGLNGASMFLSARTKESILAVAASVQQPQMQLAV
jgi:hypothetical protein